MKLIDAVSKTRGQEHGRVRHLHGDRFYNAWDSLYGLFDVELLQLGGYAQSIQNSEIKNNMVSRIATTIPEKRKAQTSGFLIQFSPEKNGAGRRHTPFDITSSTPHLLGQGGLKIVFTDASALIDTDYYKLLQSSKMTEGVDLSTLRPLLLGRI